MTELPKLEKLGKSELLKWQEMLEHLIKHSRCKGNIRQYEEQLKLVKTAIKSYGYIKK
jgi:hypothetical protein